MVEIRTKRRFFDREAKYMPGKAEEIVPAQIDTMTAARIQWVGRRAHECLGCRGLSRTDVILNAGDAVFVLEVNTLPGMTATVYSRRRHGRRDWIWPESPRNWWRWPGRGAQKVGAQFNSGAECERYIEKSTEKAAGVSAGREGATERRTRRFRSRGIAVLTVMALIAGTSYGLYRLGKFATAKLLYENPRFAIAQIVVENDGVLTGEQVKQLVGVQVGQNLLSVDLDRTRQTLEQVPIIRRVCVRRELPNRLIISVEERMAVAQLQSRAGRGTR